MQWSLLRGWAKRGLATLAIASAYAAPISAEGPGHEPSEPTNVVSFEKLVPFFQEQEFGMSKQDAEALAMMKNMRGEPVFPEERERSLFGLARGTVSYAQTLANAGFDGTSIYRFQQLGLSLDEILSFHDTERPNAVIIYPADDDARTFEREMDAEEGIAEEHQLFRKASQAYDTWVRIASNERTIYGALATVPDIKLLIIGGHGNPSSMRLGSDESEEAMLDCSDAELREYLSLLPSDCSIFLYSCENAAGDDSFADYVALQAHGRRVLAANEEFRTEDVWITSIYPFNACIIKQNYDGRVALETLRKQESAATPAHATAVEHDVTYSRP